MKLLKRTFAFMCVALTLVSCSDDDDKNKPIIPGPPIGMEVKYEVSVSADMITQISYRMGDGTTFFGQLNPDASPLFWDGSLVALFSEMPETAFLEVKCLNNTGTVQTCTLKLYRGEELAQTITSPIAPADDDPETNDVRTVSTSVVIDE
jgi:hypothetical protein